MKKIICLLMALAMLAMCMVGCKKDKEEDDNTVETIVSDGPPPYDPAIDSLYYEDKELTLYYAEVGGMPRLEYVAEEYSSDPISNVIFKRNVTVEEKFGVKLKFQSKGGIEMCDDLKTRYSAQDPTVDIIAPYTYYGVGLTTEGVYADINSLNYINPESTWWNQSYVDAITYNGKLYSLIGDLTTSATCSTVTTFVNMQMMREFGLEDTDLFEVVENGDWTLDYMIEMCKDVYSDDDSIDGRSDDDRYGFILGQISQPAEALLVSFGFKWTTYDSEGNMKFCLNDSKNIDILTALQDKLYKNDVHTGIYKAAAPTESDFATKGVAKYIELFTTKKTMMTISFLNTAEELVKTDIEYLILPVPKYDTNQTEYRSMTHDSHCNISISAMSDDKDAAAAIVEYMGYYSEKELTPQYFEISYQARYASNSYTMKLFDMVVDSVHFDFARTYAKSLGEPTHLMRNLVKDSKEISSTIATGQKACDRYLKQLTYRLDGMAN